TLFRKECKRNASFFKIVWSLLENALISTFLVSKNQMITYFVYSNDAKRLRIQFLVSDYLSI
ncbi:TPA: hypothetical protein ACGAXH_001262, partial [Streptococcus agalactiae]